VVRNLANKIAISQTFDIEIMTDLLTGHGAQPLPPPR
jgi:hypothetical protein